MAYEPVPSAPPAVDMIGSYPSAHDHVETAASSSPSHRDQHHALLGGGSSAPPPYAPPPAHGVPMYHQQQVVQPQHVMGTQVVVQHCNHPSISRQCNCLSIAAVVCCFPFGFCCLPCTLDRRCDRCGMVY